MLGTENGSDARTREEIMYWKSLNPFFKIDLHPNFRSGIEIPLHFSENVKGKLPHKVALKGPSVNIDTWEVQLRTNNDTTWVVGEGWEDFVTAFNLEENDSLVFKYKNNSYFKVRIFNGKTSCEKESSHFVVKPVSQQSKESCSLVKKTCSVKQETISEVEKVTTNNDQSSIARSSREKKALFEDSDSGDADLPVFPKRVFQRPSPFPLYTAAKVKTQRPSPFPFYEAAKVKTQRPNPSPVYTAAKVKTEPEVDYNSHLPNSCTREHRAMEIQWARQRAKELHMYQENSFFVAMSRSHVYGTMKLGIPKHWWTEVVKSNHDKCLKLRVKGKDEYDPHLYVCCYDKSNCTGTITTGWKKFVQENSLYEHDCCVFSLAKPLEGNYEFIHLEVEIVRAIPINP